jgi:hypothetical protein
MHIEFYPENFKERDHLKELDEVVRITLALGVR